jgi:hypothetical protein
MATIGFALTPPASQAAGKKSHLKKAEWVTADDHEALVFKTPQLTGRFVARDERPEFKGSGHGFRWLVFGPTGRDLHPDEGPIATHRRHRGALGMYRVYSKTKALASLRDIIAEVQQHPDGATLTWPATDERPVRISARWRISGPAQLDCEIQAVPTQDIEKFEILPTNYVPYDMTKGVYYKNADGFRATLVRPSPEHPGAADYPFYPLDTAKRGNQFHTGRTHSEWKWGTIVVSQHDVRAPLMFATDDKTQIVFMGNPESTSAVCVTPTPSGGNPNEWTNVEKHSAMYLSFFCRDVKAGEKLTARMRVVYIEAKDGYEKAHQRLYREFLSTK